MKDIYLIRYAVRGIKTVDEWASMSFYKKTFKKDFNIRGYNIKALYGVNGAGKTGIMTSAKILKGVLLDDNYLSNPLVQKHLDELINKRLEKLEFDLDYLFILEGKLRLYNYKLEIGKDRIGRYSVIMEELTEKNATSHNTTAARIYKVVNGEVVYLPLKDDKKDLLIEQSKNLLMAASFPATLLLKDKVNLREIIEEQWVLDLFSLFLFGQSIFVYLDSNDDHMNYVFMDAFNHMNDLEDDQNFEKLVKYRVRLNNMHPFILAAKTMSVKKKDYESFEKKVQQLTLFLQIFKQDLKEIEIDKSEVKSSYKCDLIMKYEDYNINAEFESTGIKKLIKLFAYFQKMVEGNIVFIDELDSNLHDVYLCALLEYLMTYGNGQICFTTHNIGPMDILKKNKRSIDFLSVDHSIYPWTASGNYSPSNLYRNGMIAGSPFNIDSTDFISALGAGEDD